MMVVQAEVHAIRLPLHQPFVVSYGRFDDMPSILIRIVTSNGVEGWGEAVPDPHVTGESFEGAYASLCNGLLPCLEGLSVFDIETLHQRMNLAIQGNASIKAAIDIAFYDAAARVLDVPLFRLLGGRAHDSLTQPYVIGIKSPDEVATEAKRAVNAGFSEIKLKVGSEDGDDIRRIRSLHDAVGTSARLRVDANQGWDRATTLEVIQQTADCRIQWYEQPLPADDLEGMAMVRRSTTARLMIDEGVHSPSDLTRVIRLAGADMVNIKLMKAGGIGPSMNLVAVAEAAHMPCQVGSMVESAIATMAGIHLAFARKAIVSNELVGPEMIAHDIAALEIPSGRVSLPLETGLGIVVDLDAVARLRVDHHEWRSAGRTERFAR